MHEPKIEGEPYEYKAWPKWCTDADGNGDIFKSEAEVPNGWSIDGKVKGAKAPPAPPAASKPPKAPRAAKAPPAPPVPPPPPAA